MGSGSSCLLLQRHLLHSFLFSLRALLPPTENGWEPGEFTSDAILKAPKITAPTGHATKSIPSASNDKSVAMKGSDCGKSADGNLDLSEQCCVDIEHMLTADGRTSRVSGPARTNIGSMRRPAAHFRCADPPWPRDCGPFLGSTPGTKFA